MPGPAPGSASGRAGAGGAHRDPQASAASLHAALLDPEKLGLGLTVHLDVALDKRDAKARDRLKAAVQTWSEVTWCHSLSGEMDYTMQVVMPDLKHYTSFLMDRVLTLPGVINVKSSFVLEKVKETTVLPLTYMAP